MRKITTFVLLLSLLAVLTPDARSQSRARRVGQTGQNPPPSPGANPTRQPSSGKAPDASRTRSSGPAPRSQEVEEEVGENDVVRVNTTLVTIPVSVMDRDGRFISELSQQDFRIFEDGVEQEVAYFATVEQPFTVALMLDTSRSTHFKLEDIQDAAIAFVNQLRPEDRVMVVAFDDDIDVLAEPTSDRIALRHAIRRTRTGGGTSLYEAVDFVINKRLNRIKGRKAIVLFTDGVDTTSRGATYNSNLRDAEELDALVYPVQYDTYNDNAGRGSPWPNSSRLPSIILGIPFPMPIPGGRRGGGGGVGNSRGDYERASAYLRDMAELTGGRLHHADDTRNLSMAFYNIAEELRRQYSLGYYPKVQSQVAGRRQVRVRAKRPNLVVRARDSYIYKPSGAPVTAQSDEESQPKPPEIRKRQFNGNVERP